MSSSAAVSCMLAVTVLALTLGVSSAVDCYSCLSSDETSACAAPFNESGEGVTTIIDCSTSCVTQFLKIGNDETWTRACLSPCGSFKEGDDWAMCCSEDLCNDHDEHSGVSRTHRSLLPILGSVLLTLSRLHR